MTNRLNARIDDELAAKLEYLTRRTRQSVTEIVRDSIELYYKRFQAEGAGDVSRIMEEAGFIGCGEDDPDLSTSYKDRLRDSLEEKTRK
ncbi:MAG: CopG family transcriptional regulator [Deltaproteobacteria bacterium]|nr:MAG: CopG family transcriptional regulator [Deltaproteobacteria bacterium]